ncbi:Mevalonate kinase [Nakaseomyces glabratus]|uniref:Mevalonate kinase n=1 Tax=Candida glabrata TaxID=5478 RepID=A0A0W0DGB6_CANGB|nr:Mevalonate kinase [Nakaseomyces glabratus]KTB02256.1 Mevalonate kinase [Nakaseomyces glabratus]KTB10824.1 Mevalonate kinase [Nakaseomyces glabratus]KTB12296.1 Mevalonate kinase [Nakaseomyces glabratus]
MTVERDLPFLVSAPGKVILFGEHSAVYNEPAVAASVSSLRTYLLVSPAGSNAEDSIELSFPDIGFDHVWNRKELEPVLRETALLQAAREDTKNLNEELVGLLNVILEPLKESLHYHAAFCFLYLFCTLCPSATNIKFSVKSTLPIGAGLGSSAAISVSLAMAMLRLGGKLVTGESLSGEDKALINEWAFIGEKCIHGTPSGIDNAVATYGNAVLFKRSADGTTDFEFLDKFHELKIPMVLTYTRIPRSTKVLVSSVRDLSNKYPKVIQDHVIKAMGELALESVDILNSGIGGNDSNYERLLDLVNINHGLLVAIGVSHPGLEIIRNLSITNSIGATKLTGAGGGGCAFTVLNKDVPQTEVDKFKEELSKKHGYLSFTSELGGAGSCMTPTLVAEQYNLVAPLFENTENNKEELDKTLLPATATNSLFWIH